jgi:hypothetical protein
MTKQKESPSNSREVQGADKTNPDRRDYTADAKLDHDSRNAAWVKALEEALAKLDREGGAR